MAELVFRKLGSSLDSSDEIWFSESAAGTIARNEFFGVTVGGTEGYVKYWTGSAWTLKPVKYWTGSAWVQKPVKFWNGTAWTLA